MSQHTEYFEETKVYVFKKKQFIYLLEITRKKEKMDSSAGPQTLVIFCILGCKLPSDMINPSKTNNKKTLLIECNKNTAVNNTICHFSVYNTNDTFWLSAFQKCPINC